MKGSVTFHALRVGLQIVYRTNIYRAQLPEPFQFLLPIIIDHFITYQGLTYNIWVYFGLGELCWTTYILQAVTRFIGHHENDSFLRSFFFISTFQAMYIFATSRHFLHIVWKKRCLFLRGGTTNHVVKKLLDQKMSLTKVVGNFTY